MRMGVALSVFLTLSLGYLAGRAWYLEPSQTPFGPYTIQLDRQYENETQRDLIHRTENLSCPDGQWYVDSFDRVLIADCVTSDAIAYYTGLIHNLSRDPDTLGFNFLSAALHYQATVTTVITANREPHSDQDNGSANGSADPVGGTAGETVYMVELNLRFSDYCGPLCAMGFNHRRTATYSIDGELLSVEGDDVHPPVWVS